MSAIEKVKEIVYPDSSKLILWFSLTTIFTFLLALAYVLMETFTSISAIPGGVPLAIVEGALPGTNFLGTNNSLTFSIPNLIIDILFWYLVAILVLEGYRRR